MHLENKQFLENIFVRFMDKDREAVDLFLQWLKKNRSVFIKGLMLANSMDDVKFLQGVLYILNNFIEVIDGEKQQF